MWKQFLPCHLSAPSTCDTKSVKSHVIYSEDIADSHVENAGPTTSPSASTSINATAVDLGPSTADASTADVETISSFPSLLPSTCTKNVSLSGPSERVKPHVVYPGDIADSHVETNSESVKSESPPEHVEESCQNTYPWKKKLTIRLRRVSDFDINLWCKTPYEPVPNSGFQVESLPVKEEPDGQMLNAVQGNCHGLHTGSKRKRSHLESDPDTVTTPSSSTSNTDSTSLLLARANKLISKVSAALDISNSDLPKQSSPVRKPCPIYRLQMWKQQDNPNGV